MHNSKLCSIPVTQRQCTVLGEAGECAFNAVLTGQTCGNTNAATTCSVIRCVVLKHVLLTIG